MLILSKYITKNFKFPSFFKILITFITLLILLFIINYRNPVTLKKSVFININKRQIKNR